MSTTVATPALLAGLRPAFALNLASAVGGNLTRLGLSLLLARLLMPAELGLASIAMALIGIAQLLRELGISSYLQREPVLDAPRFGACLGLLVVSTVLLGLLLFAAAGPLALHFGQPGLRPLLQVLLLGFVLTPFSLVMSALMLRELAAARIAAVSRLGTLAHALTALGLAAAGCGAMSLAWAYVVNIVVCSLAYWPLRPGGLAWQPRWTGWRPVLRFGLGALVGNGLDGMNNALPDLLLGRLGSVQQVGLLGRANALVGLFNSLLGTAINFGALRGLADLHHRQVALAPALLRATALLTCLAWPLLALTALFGEPLLVLLYGRPWRDSAAAIPPLAATVALGLLFHYPGLALAAIGRPLLAAAPLALILCVRLVLVVLCFDGRLAGFAWLLLGAALAAMPLQLLLIARGLRQPLTPWFACAARSLLPCAAAVAAVALLRGRMPLVPVLAAAFFIWLLALRLLRHALLDEFLQLLRLRSTIRK